jgi:hypothetical protein
LGADSQVEGNEHSPVSSVLSDLEDPEPAPLDEDEQDENFTLASDDPSVVKEESDDESADAPVKEEDDDEIQADEGEEPEDELKEAIKEANNLPEGFVEWEAVSL